jgi:hypothetical protein
LFGRRSIARLLALLLISAPIFYSPPSAAGPTVPVELNKILVDIFVPGDQGKPVLSGTGFFVVVKDITKPDNAFGYLVTAKHILQDSRGQFYSQVFIKLNKIKGGTDLLRLDLNQNGRSWVFALPNPNIDIAVVPALPNTAEYDFRAIPEEMIQSAKSFADLEIGDGSDIFFVSALQAYGTDEAIIPIARFGHIAWMQNRLLAWRPNSARPVQPTSIFLIEGQSSGGDQGAPVFLMPNPDDAIESFITESPTFKLIGVILGDYRDPAGTSTSAMPGSRQSLSIAAVAPSFYLYQIIFSDELKKMRSGAVEQAKR